MNSEETAVHAPVVDATRTDTPPVVIDMDRRRTADLGPLETPAPNRSALTGYEDMEEVTRRSLETARMLASLRVSGEQIDPAATERTIGQIQALRAALGGLGLVGQHFNAVGSPVADQVAVILSASEVEALIMRLTGMPRSTTIVPS